MNRVIKFRAWDKKLKIWNLSVEIDCFGNIQEYKFNGSAFHPKYQTEYDEWYSSEKGIDRFELCQFTGLLDKNGKEIYEGDIIKYLQHQFNTSDEKWKYKTKVVKWNYDKWNIYETNAGESEIEVIGNIYENPELI